MDIGSITGFKESIAVLLSGLIAAFVGKKTIDKRQDAKIKRLQNDVLKLKKENSGIEQQIREIKSQSREDTKRILDELKENRNQIFQLAKNR